VPTRRAGRRRATCGSTAPRCPTRRVGTYFLQLPATQGDGERSGYDALIDAVLPEQATALKKQLVSVLDPANPSGNTYLISVK
jgi:hypothetical protein